MSSDRGTMQRGPAPGIDQQGAWPQPTAPTGRRVPGAPRERKPALAALAVLLILGGALGAGFLVLQSGKRVAAIEISQPIGVGQQIPLSAMQEVLIASGTGLDYVPWSEAGQVAQFYAATAIPPRTLLTNAMVGRAGNVTAGKAVVGLSLKDGQVPAQLQVGDHVNIYQVSDAPETCPGSSGSMLARDAVVLDITNPASSSSSAVADVRVAVAPADAGAVACNSSNGIVGLAILPAGAAAASAPTARTAPVAPTASTFPASPTAQPSQTPGTTTPGGQASPTASPGTGTG
ncbi:MAG: hypothetical protein QOJ73_4854 [Streptosporangiaceae bacterium]|jgi:hypothetical protein|nr:hypothetical protein [Streptosporangiaceae bacterium]